MGLRERLSESMKAAMKAKEVKRLSTVRLMLDGVQKQDIATRETISDDEVLGVFAKMIKQREESEKIYAEAGRAELAKQEAEEIVIIREFLPRQLSGDELEKAVAEAIAKAGASSIKDMGKVMAELKACYAGQMDFAKAGGLVKAKLG